MQRKTPTTLRSHRWFGREDFRSFGHRSRAKQAGFSAEDLAGKPFVGPAGRLLDECLQEAGVDRSLCYVTNAVKHFKFVPAERGKRRIHKTPSRTEVVACRPWLVAELDRVSPELVVALGATAAKALLGQDFRVTRQRGEVVRTPDRGERVVATVHPSSVLRSDDREKAYRGLLADLTAAAEALGKRSG